MNSIVIRPFHPDDIDDVFSLILPIQREEYGMDITADHQPDLSVIPDFYQSGKGQFWVAARNDQLVGTLGLKDMGHDQLALRKMFVEASLRGSQYGVGAQLLDIALAHAKQHMIRDIFLGTTAKFLAAHRFYEKNGFSEIPKESLPASFPVMPVDRKFYWLGLRSPAETAFSPF